MVAILDFPFDQFRFQDGAIGIILAILLAYKAS